MRGDVYSINLNRAVGHEQRGQRYAVVVQDDLLMLSTVIICPTSTSARPTLFRPAVEVQDVETLIMCDQVQSVDVTRLGRIVGRLTFDEMRTVDAALIDILDLA